MSHYTGKIISDETVESITSELRERIGADSAGIYLELQDDAHCLLIHITPKEDVPKSRYAGILREVQTIVSPAVPPERKYCSWVATISRSGLGGKVEDALNAEIL